MRIIFGLGNPGSEYEGTRHNVGFDVLDAIAESERLRFVPGRGEFEFARSGGEHRYILVRPLTFMNNSGLAVREVLEEYGVELSETLTIVDDFELPLGTLRLRRRGSAGTHNGLASIVWGLGSDDFPRLRCGIGSEHKPHDKHLTADFVLSPFAGDEQERAAEMIRRAAKAATAFGEESLHKALEVLSTQPK